VENKFNEIKSVRFIDDQVPDLAAAQRRQFRGDDFDMPAHREAGARVELAETPLREADEIAPQQRAVLVRVESIGWEFHHGDSEGTEKGV
jgi:hypothetical protein